MKSLLAPLLILLVIAAVGFQIKLDREDKRRNEETAAALKTEQQRAEFTAILKQVGGDHVKAQDVAQRKRYAESIEGITTFDTPTGQKLHYFPDPNHNNFLLMLRAYMTLHPDEIVVSFAGDSNGDTNAGNANVSRHNGYNVVTQKVRPRE
jgi:hypothetical protein